jgi:hypothetical protein
MRRRLTLRPRMRGLGDGFAGAPSNYWSTLAGKRVQLVPQNGNPSVKLVPKPILGRYRLGDVPPGTQLQAYGLDVIGNPVYIDPNTGDVYDVDGNPLTDLSTIDSSPAGAALAAGGGRPAASPGSTGNVQVPRVVNNPPPPRQPPSWWNQSTLIPGVNNSSVVMGGGLLALFLGSMGHRRGR